MSRHLIFCAASTNCPVTMFKYPTELRLKIKIMIKHHKPTQNFIIAIDKSHQIRTIEFYKLLKMTLFLQNLIILNSSLIIDENCENRI